MAQFKLPDMPDSWISSKLPIDGFSLLDDAIKRENAQAQLAAQESEARKAAAEENARKQFEEYFRTNPQASPDDMVNAARQALGATGQYEPVINLDERARTRERAEKEQSQQNTQFIANLYRTQPAMAQQIAPLLGVKDIDFSKIPSIPVIKGGVGSGLWSQDPITGAYKILSEPRYKPNQGSSAAKPKYITGSDGSKWIVDPVSGRPVEQIFGPKLSESEKLMMRLGEKEDEDSEDDDPDGASFLNSWFGGGEAPAPIEIERPSQTPSRAAKPSSGAPKPGDVVKGSDGVTYQIILQNGQLRKKPVGR